MYGDAPIWNFKLLINKGVFLFQIYEDSIKLGTVFTYARETLEKTGHLPPSKVYDGEDGNDGEEQQDDDESTESITKTNDDTSKQDSDDEGKVLIAINFFQSCTIEDLFGLNGAASFCFQLPLLRDITNTSDITA